MIGEFIRWYFNDFTTSNLYADMKNLVENSPWHRERTTACHTDMVVANYLSQNIVPLSSTSKKFVLGLFAAAFHDVGKPLALSINTNKHNKRNFSGHEKLSARLWENWAVSHFEWLSSVFGFTIEDIFSVGVAIQMHLPWGIKRQEKIDEIVETSFLTIGRHAFARLLLSDVYGRISDDGETKQQSALTWVEEFLNMPPKPRAPFGSKVLHVPVSPVKLSNHSFVVDATLAFDQVSDNVRREFIELTKHGKSIYLDSWNLSKKDRRFFITEARNKGYSIMATVGVSALQSLKQYDDNFEQSKKRYFRLAYPLYGEVDYITVQRL